MKRLIKYILYTVFGQTRFREQRQAKQNEFIDWIRFANAGMLNTGNIYCFEYAVEHLPSGNPIVEIGSFCGLSTNLISFYLRKNNKANKLITCDKWIFEGAENGGLLGDSDVGHPKYRDFVRESYIRNISFFSENHLPYTIEEFSDEFFEAWKSGENRKDVLGRDIKLGGPISFAYIDGNHTYEFAKRDFENADRYLESGGFILFDDSADDSQWEVRRVIKEIKESGRYEIVINNPNYLVKKK
jgi:Methyltransferase domain/Domain of unknown function (DUF4159)